MGVTPRHGCQTTAVPKYIGACLSVLSRKLCVEQGGEVPRCAIQTAGNSGWYGWYRTRKREQYTWCVEKSTAPGRVVSNRRIFYYS